MVPIARHADHGARGGGGGNGRGSGALRVALARGVHPKVVQEAMGHSIFAVTLDLYSHVVPTLQTEPSREIGNALLG